MEILFSSSSLWGACNRQRKGIRKFGAARFAMLNRRLDELSAAETLADIPPSAGCHRLKGDRAGQFAVSLDGSWRLIFRPNHETAPRTTGAGIDLRAVTKVLIIEVVDYHD